MLPRETSSTPFPASPLKCGDWTRSREGEGNRACGKTAPAGSPDNLYYPGDEDGTDCMASWLLTLGIIFIVIAIVLMLLGFIGRIAWTIGKWLIIIFIVLALLSWVFAVI